MDPGNKLKKFLFDSRNGPRRGLSKSFHKTICTGELPDRGYPQLRIDLGKTIRESTRKRKRTSQIVPDDDFYLGGARPGLLSGTNRPRREDQKVRFESIEQESGRIFGENLIPSQSGLLKTGIELKCEESSRLSLTTRPSVQLDQ